MRQARVLKLGGSLFALADWPEKLRHWLLHHPFPVNLVVCGGGEIVEALRQLDRLRPLPSDFVHWLCIDLLSATTQIAGQRLDEFPIIADEHQLARVLQRDEGPPSSRTPQEENYLVQVSSFYNRKMPTPLLSEDWQTTSDSIAAYLARLIEAPELILLKSISPQIQNSGVEQWTVQGLVDPNLMQVIPQGCTVRLVNLKDYC